MIDDDPPFHVPYVKNPSCGTCVYWTNNRLTFARDCRRHAPIAHITATEFGYKTITKWPQTETADFCGDYRAAQ